MHRPNSRNPEDVWAAISGVDQKIRECLQVFWLSLPKDKRNLGKLEKNGTAYLPGP
ncbi:hypothetical protein G8764_16350 [Pseudomaricurvus alcaniphilus]|nr:hypothetical protein [Pseudomaricurvus alcaniphilus]